MPEITFDLYRYDGHASVNGVDFARVHLSEHADSDGGKIRRGWQGTAQVGRRAAPAVTPEWASIQGPVEVRLPEGGTGRAFIQGLTLTDGLFWEVELLGVGPSPMEQSQAAT